MMLIPIYYFHTIVLTIVTIYLLPKRGGKKEYHELFNKELPTFYSLSIWLFAIIYLYFLIDVFTKGWIGVNYIDSFDNEKCYIIMAIYAVAIFIFLFHKLKKEILNVSQNHKNYRIWVVPFIYIFIYSSSVLLSVVVFHFTNHFLDFSKGEEHVVTVISSDRRIIDRKSNSFTYCELSFRPSVYNLNKLVVSSHTQGHVNFGDKIKVYVYKGLYGVRYVSNSINLK